MSKYDKVSEKRKKQILAFNRQRAADSEAAADMHAIAAAIGRLPKGQLKKLLTDDIVGILAKYGVEVG